MESYAGSIEFNDADLLDIVVGLAPVNRGLRLLLKQEQKQRNGKRLVGRFQILDSGDGEYSAHLAEFVGETSTANEFVERLLSRINENPSRQLKTLHIFNCNMLGVETNDRKSNVIPAP